MTAMINLTGKHFGRLIAVERAGATRFGNARWRCVCACGLSKIVAAGHLRSKVKPTVSCGCLAREKSRVAASGLKFKHGAAGGAWPEYRAWCDLKSRCFNPNNRAYKNYGGRGITVCDRWLGDAGFANFIADIGRRPSPEHSIDRYPDNDGHYEPDNCRWATPKQQRANQRRRKKRTGIEHQGASP